MRIQPCQEERNQPGLKFADPGGGRGHIHGLLPTTEHDLHRREAPTGQCCFLLTQHIPQTQELTPAPEKFPLPRHFFQNQRTQRLIPCTKSQESPPDGAHNHDF